MKWFRKSAEQNFPGGQYYLGTCYDFVMEFPFSSPRPPGGGQGRRPRLVVTAQRSFGVCCEPGDGVSKDPAEAAGRNGKAAEQGDALVENHLARCPLTGTGRAPARC